MADNKKSKEKICFVVGPIGDIGTDVRRKADFLLNGIIKHVLQDSMFSYKVIRADEITKPGIITDQVIELCSKADLVIADLTGHNPNAFYELAIAHMSERPVVPMIEEGQEIPFDNYPVRTIFYNLGDWEKIEKVREYLKNHVTEIEDPKHEISNPVTAANMRIKLRTSTDEKDQLFTSLMDSNAAMMQRMNALEKKQMIKEVSALNENRGLFGLSLGMPGAIDLGAPSLPSSVSMASYVPPAVQFTGLTPSPISANPIRFSEAIANVAINSKPQAPHSTVIKIDKKEEK